MQAPWSQQLELLSVQRLDTKITRLNFQIRNLSQIEELKQVDEKFKLINLKKVQLETAKADLKRSEASLESDLEQARSRRTRQQNRLDNGEGSPKELLALQSELEVLDKRIADLEDKQLPVLENLEKLAGLEASLLQKEAQWQAKAEQLQSDLDKQSQQLEAEKAKLIKEREEKVSRINQELVDLYEEIRERTGGVGAVKVIDTYVPGTGIEFSAAEASQIRSAKPEEILVSEENEVILVRCPEE